jgi:4-diphosphocytidyl-2-C-methyl-D-erythritol kinase
VLSILAPAKINLVLEVLGKREDGYHEICSIMQTVSLCDSLSFELADEIWFQCSEPSLQNRDNLVIRAAEMLQKVCGCKKGARITLEKRIPHSAGLGGGSSDAAITLLALNELWSLELPNSQLVQLAAILGSDVPFFSHRGTALVEGRGEKVTPVSQSQPNWFVLLVPQLPLPQQKTQELYSRLDNSHYTEGSYVTRALEVMFQGRLLPPSLLFNVFDAIAFNTFPGLEDYWRRFEAVGAENIHLAGSGPTLFAITTSKARANEWHRQLRKQEFETYCVSTLEAQVV